jgi:hypothetical protein
MDRFLDIFFAPVLRPLLAVLLLAFTYVANSPAMVVVTQWYCATKALLCAAMSLLLVYAAFTLQPSANPSEISQEMAQVLVLAVAYFTGALALAYYRLAGHFKDCHAKS